jgi:hypothetical protein
MTQREARSWAKYIAKHGSINISKRLEHSVALLACSMLRSQGRAVELIDFMPNAPRPEPQVASVHDVFAMLKALKKVPA